MEFPGSPLEVYCSLIRTSSSSTFPDIKLRMHWSLYMYITEDAEEPVCMYKSLFGCLEE